MREVEVEAGLVMEAEGDDEADGDVAWFDMTEMMVTATATATATASRCYRHLQRKVNFKVTYRVTWRQLGTFHLMGLKTKPLEIHPSLFRRTDYNIRFRSTVNVIQRSNTSTASGFM